ncbi:MAG TPA: serine hydrolase [Planctomycetota bacterium]|nr:serine hydrolase [Planctomycetota bacterium]
MSQLVWRVLLSLLVLGCGLRSAQAAASEYDFSAATKQLSDNLALYAGGNVLVVVQQGDREIFRYQAGATQEDTKYGLASCTKWLSGAIILRMHEKGLFTFEDEVGKYLPFFNDYSNQNGVTGSVTIQQCCSMKAGLYSTQQYDWQMNPFMTLEQTVKKIPVDVPLAFPPGTKLAYEGNGLQAVGRICELVDPQGRSWRTIAADELFTPVGMANCDYNYFSDKNPVIGAGVQGTARAYLRFLKTLMNGGVTPEGQVYLRPRSMRHFLVNQTRDLPEHYSPCPDPPEIYPNNTKPDYGTASWIMVDDPNYPQSKEAIEVASPGGFGTWPWIDRKRNLRGIIYMFDSPNGGTKTSQNNLKVIQAIRDAIDAVGEPAKPSAAIAASTLTGWAPLTVSFSASGSTDPEGDALTCVWDFGSEAVLGSTTSRTFSEPGSYEVVLNVTDCKGTFAMTSVTINVTAPPPSGQAKGAGANSYGQLGDGTTTARKTVVDAAGAAGVVAVASGQSHTLALKADGTVLAWGLNTSGQLGDGTKTTRLTPVAVPGLTGVVAVAAGNGHSLALLSDGTVRAWGVNKSGQLGDGTTTMRLVPTAVPGLVGVAAIAAGGTHSLALTSGGAVLAWGANGKGQLGDGTTTTRKTPVAVTGLGSGVARIAAGLTHSLAVTTAGAAMAWGDNAYGQLGDGTTTGRKAPVAVTGLGSGVSAVAGGGYHTLAVLADGTVKSWGRNSNGQLGDGTTTTRKTPVAVSGVSGALSVAAGSGHSVVRLSDGTAKAWGSNASGQLGDGTTTKRLSAVAMTGVSGAVSVAAGGNQTILAAAP